MGVFFKNIKKTPIWGYMTFLLIYLVHINFFCKFVASINIRDL